MRLSSFHIKNFKSIVDTGVCHLSENDNILVLAGQNEAGKSAVIEALNFFGNGPSADFEKLHRRREEDPEVICEFALDKNDMENIFVETQNDKLKKYLISHPTVGLIRCSDLDNKFDDIFFTDQTEEELSHFFSSDVPVKDKISPSSGVEETSINVTTLEAFLEFMVSEQRKFVFYNLFDDLLPGLVAIKAIPQNNAVQDFQHVFGINFAEIVKKDDRGVRRSEIDLNNRASDDLNAYWTQKLEENSKYNFTIKIIRKEPVAESTVEFMVDRADGDPLYLEQKSNGFRWFSSFNLRLRALGVKEATIKNLVILIDEPGQGLHEKAQKDLKKVIEELGKKGAQIIYTTHYPNLIGTVGKEFSRIRVISNTNAKGTKVETVAQFASRADIGATDALSPLITAMGIQSIGSLIDQQRLNILVEGITDHYYFSAFKKLLNKNPHLYFIPACGVSNVPNLASVLIGWGFNYKAVFDDDVMSGRKAYNLLKKEFYEEDDMLTHEHVLKIKECTGIEDIFSPRDFYKFVLQRPFPKGTITKNSELVKGKKEALSRLFLERVENNEIISFDKHTLAKVQEIFSWIEDKLRV